MNKYYDKILLVLSILVVAASCAYYFKSDANTLSAISASKQSLIRPFAGEKWNEISIPTIKLETKQWAAVKPQDEEGLWLYQLFTSPKIWMDSEGAFIAEPPAQGEIRKKMFGFKFGGVKNDAYPLTYKGFYIDPDNNTIVNFYDGSSNRFMRGKIGDEIAPVAGKPLKTNIFVKKFDRKPVTEKSTGRISVVVVVLLDDKNIGKEVEVYSDKPTYLEENRVMALSPDATMTKVWEIKKSGETFESDGIKYTVKELDFENESAIVERVLPKGTPAVQVMKLSKEGLSEIK